MSDWGISTYYDSTFGTIDFWTQAPANTPTYDEEAVEYHYPGSDDNLVVLLGQKVVTLELTVACNETDYADLVAAQGTSATLDYPGLPSSVTARLRSVRGQVHEHFTGIYQVQLTFSI